MSIPSIAVAIFALLALGGDAATMRGAAIRRLQAKSEVPCSEAAQYTVVLDCEWNGVKHPVDYPDTAHWSPLCGTAHSEEASLFEVGGTASDGVKLVAETGACTILEEEVAACGDECGAFLKFPCDPFSGTCTSSGMVDVTEDKSYLSVLSMIAPSPDWIVGVDSFNLCKDGVWLSAHEEDLMAMDAGTDDGTTFKSDDVPVDPRAPISVFDAMDTSNIFYNEAENTLHPLCKISMTLGTA